MLPMNRAKIDKLCTNMVHENDVYDINYKLEAIESYEYESERAMENAYSAIDDEIALLIERCEREE